VFAANPPFSKTKDFKNTLIRELWCLHRAAAQRRHPAGSRHSDEKSLSVLLVLTNSSRNCRVEQGARIEF
jgi:hypothetical protein